MPFIQNVALNEEQSEYIHGIFIDISTEKMEFYHGILGCTEYCL